jgi:carbamoyl-phosphate synthase small subunit
MDVFISNGPGDPAMCDATVENIKKAIDAEKPIMGICLGNQLLARAAGAETYKLKYGHRSHNQPVLLTGTNRCFITSQNHGFAVATETLPNDWEPLFHQRKRQYQRRNQAQNKTLLFNTVSP